MSETLVSALFGDNGSLVVFFNVKSNNDPYVIQCAKSASDNN